MAVRKGNAVLKAKFPRSHEGITPYYVQEKLEAADVATGIVLLAEIPAQFTVRNAEEEVVVHAEATGFTDVNLVVAKEDGTVIKSIIDAMDLNTAAPLEVYYAKIALEGSWWGPVPDQGEPIFLALELVTGTVVVGAAVTVGGHYAAGLDRIGLNA